MMTVLEKANQKRDAAERGMGYGLPGYDWSYLQWWTAYIEGAEDQKREDAAAIEALQAEVNEQKQIAAHYEQSAKDWWGEACEYKAQLPHWVSVEDELPKSGTHVLACCEVHGINGYRGHYVCDAFHTDKKSISCSYNDDIDEEYDEETDEYYFPVGWWEVVKNWDDYSCVAINDVVTHWMPLPEPPREVQE